MNSASTIYAPIRDAFKELLSLSDPKRVMYRSTKGPVTAAQMLELLSQEEPDPMVTEYLADIQRVCIDVLGLRARREQVRGDVGR